eukprot:CAMPEP_0203753266 /NCGR_PEP_ID=MMETSP0098-20131031/7057_1 /ASSEMBLY_ACC=CAM_ASM_000208 /TAXON_ID=96639 /ORGANISM=" , Strain NY0313808BC1" /LENGTH=602 /DNA_ID=CAMNT_0050643783 /DNA_START=488 /DNA_END=2296 /DNA_ORIENTATION=-
MKTPVTYHRSSRDELTQKKASHHKSLFASPEQGNPLDSSGLDSEDDMLDPPKHSNVNPFCKLDETILTNSVASTAATRSECLESSPGERCLFSSPSPGPARNRTVASKIKQPSRKFQHHSRSDSFKSIMSVSSSTGPVDVALRSPGPAFGSPSSRIESPESRISPSSLCGELKRTCSLMGSDTEADQEDKRGNQSPSSDILLDEDKSDSPPARHRGKARCAQTPQPMGQPMATVRMVPRRRTIGGKDRKEAKIAKHFSRFQEEFETRGVLGGGTFGTVYLCKNRLDGCMYAVKVTKQRFKGKADRERVLKEVYALAALCNSEENNHIVRYFSAFVEDGRLYIQTELCERSLQDMIRTESFPGGIETVAKEMGRQVLQGLARLHKQNLAHLDIKPANIFVKNGVYKVGDLGHACLARIQQVPLPAPPAVDGKDPGLIMFSPVKGNNKVHSSGDMVEEGDSRYMAQEILNEDYSNLTKGDIFSLGASMYEMFLGRELPANGPEWHDIRNGILDPLAMRYCSDSLRDLITLMLLKDPVRRPSAETLLASGGPGGILRTEWENKLAREQAAAEEYRKELARIKSTTGASQRFNPEARYRFRRSNTM